VFGVQCIQSEFCDRCSLKRKLLRKIIHTFWLNSLLCWKRINGTVNLRNKSLHTFKKTTTACLQDFLGDCTSATRVLTQYAAWILPVGFFQIKDYTQLNQEIKEDLNLLKPSGNFTYRQV
jgi:hypothetical protein